MRAHGSPDIMTRRNNIVGWLFGAVVTVQALLIAVAYATGGG